MKQLFTLFLLLTLNLSNAQDYRVEVDLSTSKLKITKDGKEIKPSEVEHMKEIKFEIKDEAGKFDSFTYEFRNREKGTKKIIKNDILDTDKLTFEIKKHSAKNFMEIVNGGVEVIYPYNLKFYISGQKEPLVVNLGSTINGGNDDEVKIVKIQYSSDINILEGIDDIVASPRPNLISKKEKDRRIKKAKKEKEEEVKKQKKILENESDPNKQTITKKVKSVFMAKEEDLENIITEEDFYCPLLKGGDAILLVDFAASKSNTTKLYRKKSDCEECEFECCNKEVRWRDNLKVYIENINPYKYNIKVSSNFRDNTPEMKPPFDSPKTPKSREEIEATATGDEKNMHIQKLFDYQKATLQLKTFIDNVKANSIPDAFVLEEQKRIIIKNIYESEIFPNFDIDKLYKDIGDSDYYSSYLVAKQFNQVYYEMLNLTYIVLGSEILINIASFDVLILKLGLYDSSNRLLQEKEFNYLIRGGFKVDQSFGVALHTIRDQEFSLRTFMDKDTSYLMKPNGERVKDINLKDSIASITPAVRKEIMKEESPSQFAIGASTLTHLYYRWTGVFSVGPELGISADIYPKTELRYLLGVGVLFKDERHRISLDVGYAFGKSLAFSQGQNYGTILKGDQATPALIDKHQAKLYFGISYNVPLVSKNTQDVKP